MRQTASTVIFEILAGIVAMIMLAGGVLAVRLASGPLEINLFKGDIEAALETARDGRGVTLDTITLEWLAGERRMVVVAKDLEFLDERGTRAARAGRTEIVLDATALALGQVEVLQLRMVDGWLSFVRDETGWSVAGEPVGEVGGTGLGDLEAGAPPDPDRLLTLTGQTLADALQAIKGQVDGVEIERVRIDDFDIIFADEDGTEFARFGSANGLLRRDGGGIRLRMSGRSDNAPGLPVGVAVDLRAPADFSQISGEFGFAGWSLGELLGRVGYPVEGLNGLAADLSIGVEVTADGGLSDITARAEVDAGQLSLGGQDVPVDAFALDALYDRSTDQLSVELGDFSSSLAEGVASLTLSGVLQGEGAARDFRVTSPDLSLDLRPRFEAPWRFRRIAASGSVDWNEGVLSFDALTLRRGGVSIAMRGVLSAAHDAEEGQLPLRLKLAAEFAGDQTMQDILSFWPVTLTPGTRRYLDRNVLAGDISEVIARVDIRPDSLAGGILADDAVDLRFAARDVSVKFLHDLPAASKASATGKLTGNSFRIDFKDGALQDWAIDEGFVHYPKLNPAGNIMRVFAKGHGEVTEMMQMISDSRFQLEARSGFDPTRLAGEGEVTFQFSRPTGDGMTLADADISAEGRATGASFKSVLNGIDLTEAVAQIDLTEEAMTVTGYGDLGPAGVQFTWRDLFTDNNGPAMVQASGEITPDFLNQFGILGRAYLSGGVPADISATISGTGIQRADIALDFGPARLIVDELGWIKPADEPATGQLRYVNSETGPSLGGYLRAEDLAFEGNLVLAQNGGIASADLSQAFLEDRMDVTATIRRTVNDVLEFKLKGELLDVSDFLGSVGDLGAGVAGGDESGLQAHISLDAEVNRLILREGFEMSEATLSVVTAGEDGLQLARAGGLTQAGSLFSARYEAGDAGPDEISMRAADAGFITNALFGLDLIEGGTLDLKGTLGMQDRPADISVRMEDVRLKEAPAFTQVLSLASLRGLNDTLAGDGVLFTEVEVPVLIQDGRFHISGGRASGPALGMTARGWFDSDSEEMDIEGVLVPSFGVNSALGGIPIVGDLFVGRRGEGVFSISYGIEGSLSEAQVSVNPLSAITPGVLRRIFESPESELPLVRPPPVSEPAPDEASDQAGDTPN